MTRPSIFHCYNCGIELTPSKKTREHIPAQTLYTDYPIEYKNNRITVPACEKCNNEYSKIDQEFRNFIGNMAANEQVKGITSKTVNAIFKRNALDRLVFNSEGELFGMTFKEKDILDFHIKNFKGVFYHRFKQPLPQDFKIRAFADENDWSIQNQKMISFLREFQFKESGHPDVFQYIIQPLRVGTVNSEGDIEPRSDDYMYGGLLRYNNCHAAMVIAMNEKITKEQLSLH